MPVRTGQIYYPGGADMVMGPGAVLLPGGGRAARVV